MKRLWAHPANDQRPAVREWLCRQDVTCKSVIDIGCGDGYYLDILKPRFYVGVDPNEELIKQCKDGVHAQGVEACFFPCVAKAVERMRAAQFDLLLLIHSLLYITLDDLHSLLTRVSARRCMIVHPEPSRSTTIAFEESIGVHSARELIKAKVQILGPACSVELLSTHLCFDAASTSDQEIAYVVAHRAVPFGDRTMIMDKAMEFVIRKRDSWTLGGVVKVPQCQRLEVFAM